MGERCANTYANVFKINIKILLFSSFSSLVATSDDNECSLALTIAQVTYMQASQFNFSALDMKSFSMLVLCGIFFIIMLWYSVENMRSSSSDVIFKDIDEITREDPKIVRNIEDRSALSADGENVFFVETRNTTRHELSDRQACSVESAGMLIDLSLAHTQMFFD
jgi:hypothetical protein